MVRVNCYRTCLQTGKAGFLHSAKPTWSLQSLIKFPVFREYLFWDQIHRRERSFHFSSKTIQFSDCRFRFGNFFLSVERKERINGLYDKTKERKTGFGSNKMRNGLAVPVSWKTIKFKLWQIEALDSLTLVKDLLKQRVGRLEQQGMKFYNLVLAVESLFTEQD